jgi:hypothetical protein
MPEPDLGTERRQPRFHRLRLGLDRDTQPPGIGRDCVKLAGEAVLDPGSQRPGGGQPEPAGQFGRAQPAREFQQCQRVPVALRDDQIPDPRIQRRGQRRVEQYPGVVRWQPADFQRGQTGQIGARLADGEHQPDGFGLQTAGYEAQRLGRGPVQPPEQETARRRPRSQAERGLQRVALWPGQAFRAAEHRPAQLMQPGKRKFHLRLHARRPSQPASRTAGPLGQVLQQHGLADAGLTADNQHRAASGPDRLDHIIKRVTLSTAAGQPVHARAPPGHGLTWPPG